MLHVENISAGYGNGFVLRDISFRLARGECVGVIGPNGSGKTTLLRALAHTLSFRGVIRLQGRGLDVASSGQRARLMAVVTQEQNLSTPLTVEACVSLGRIPHQGRLQFFASRRDAAVIDRALELTGLTRLRTRLLETLSGGERQLVFIARALAQEPILLLLDEPVVHLDIAHQVHVLDLIVRLCRRRDFGVLIVLHELNLASEYCDRLLLLQEGGLKAAGEPAAVLQQALLEEVYKTPLHVQDNPLSGRPQIAVVARHGQEKAYA